MAVTGNDYGLFWNSVNEDRTYNADSFELWLKKFFTSGVFNGELQVTAYSGVTVAVSGGYANVDGKVMFAPQQAEITLDAPNSTYPRIDTIVIRRDNTERQITIEKVTGAYSGSSPVPTAPVRTGGIYELVLAQIYVGAGASIITQADITDTRMDSDICGYVTGTVEEIDFSQISAQFESYLSQFEAENLDAFEDWFEHMKDQLSEDAAGHLQAEIDDMNELVYTSSDDLDPTSSESVALLTSGETQISRWQKVSQMFKNIRYLLKRLGTTDISSIGDGTITGGISTLNVSLTELEVDFYGNVHSDDIHSYTSTNRYTTPHDGYLVITMTGAGAGKEIQISGGNTYLTWRIPATNYAQAYSFFVKEGTDLWVSTNTVGASNSYILFRYSE